MNLLRYNITSIRAVAAINLPNPPPHAITCKHISCGLEKSWNFLYKSAISSRLITLHFS